MKFSQYPQLKVIYLTLPLLLLSTTLLNLSYAEPSQEEKQSGTMLKPFSQESIDQAVINQLRIIAVGNTKKINIPDENSITPPKENILKRIASSEDKPVVAILNPLDNVLSEELEKIAIELNNTPTFTSNIQPKPTEKTKLAKKNKEQENSDIKKIAKKDNDKKSDNVKKVTKKRIVAIKEDKEDIDTEEINKKITASTNQNKKPHNKVAHTTKTPNKDSTKKKLSKIIKTTTITKTKKSSIKIQLNDKATNNKNRKSLTKGYNQLLSPGWIYLGKFEEGKWQVKTLDIEDKLPNVGEHYFISATSINVRRTPIKKDNSKAFHWLKKGTSVTILKLHQSGRSKHYWAEITTL